MPSSAVAPLLARQAVRHDEAVMIYLQLEIQSAADVPHGRSCAEVLINCRDIGAAMAEAEEALARLGWRALRVFAIEDFCGREDALLLSDPLLYARAKFTGSALRLVNAEHAAQPCQVLCAA